MLKHHVSNQFKKDLKKVRKQGKDDSKIQWVLEQIVLEKELPERYRDHALTGNYVGHRECHIEPGWLLIYYKTHEAVTFVRTGSHSELLNK